MEDEETMKTLDEVADSVFDEAEHESAFQGVELLLIVVDESGAYRFRCREMDVNKAVGVLTRAACDMSAMRSNK